MTVYKHLTRQQIIDMMQSGLTATAFEKEDFIHVIGNYLNTTQLSSLIKNIKFGPLKPSSSIAQIQQKGGGPVASKHIKKTMEHHNVNKQEYIEALMACKMVASIVEGK